MDIQSSQNCRKVFQNVTIHQEVHHVITFFIWWKFSGGEREGGGDGGRIACTMDNLNKTF